MSISPTWLACYLATFSSYHPHNVKKVEKRQANHVCYNIKFAHQNLCHKSYDWSQFMQSAIQDVLLL